MSDYYRILGVEQSASADEIKKAYRKKAIEFHPDKNQGDVEAEEKFKKINKAYDVLKDPQKKSNYDQFGNVAGRPNMGSRTSSHGFQGFGNGFHANSDASEMNDVINEFMRAQGMNMHGNRQGFDFNQPQKNPDLMSEMIISLEDAYKGTTTTVELTEPDGNTKSINVSIPAGSKHGLTLRLREKGYQNNTDLPPGDLHLRIHIKPHNSFVVMGMDLIMEKNVNMVDAALGCKIEVSLLDGKTIKVSIPEGTQPNQKIRLKGKGMPGLNNINVYGDLYIKINIEIPTNLTEEQREVLRSF